MAAIEIPEPESAATTAAPVDEGSGRKISYKVS